MTDAQENLSHIIIVPLVAIDRSSISFIFVNRESALFYDFVSHICVFFTFFLCTQYQDVIYSPESLIDFPVWCWFTLTGRGPRQLAPCNPKEYSYYRMFVL